jgi:hypothetical protein
MIVADAMAHLIIDSARVQLLLVLCCYSICATGAGLRRFLSNEPTPHIQFIHA